MGAQIVDVLQHLPGSGNVRLTIPPREVELHIELLPDRLAAYGLQAADVLQTVNAAYHGTAAAQLAQADRSVPVAVRIAGAGADPGALGALELRGRDGAMVPLSSVAKITTELARSLIDHQDGLRRQIVVATPTGCRSSGLRRGRAQGDRRPRCRCLPAFISIRRSGRGAGGGSAGAAVAFGGGIRTDRLAARLAFGSSRHVLLVLAALPSTLIGGVAAVALTGGTLTLGAMVGFVALFGMAARNTILLISHYDHLVAEEGESWSIRDLDARRGGAADAGIAHRTAHGPRAAAGGAAAASSPDTRSRARWRSLYSAGWYPLHSSACC